MSKKEAQLKEDFDDELYAQMDFLRHRFQWNPLQGCKLQNKFYS